MPGAPNPKNYPDGAASDLGLALDKFTLESEEEKKRKRLQMQRDTGGLPQADAATSLLGGLG